MHLAQLNIARLREPIDSPALTGFLEALEPIYQVSDSAPGFVWRLQEGDLATDLIQYEDDRLLLVNLSVWESRETLWNFAYRSAHLEVMRRRREWFHRMAEPYMVLWWVPEGHLPTVDEAMARLSVLRAEGAGPEAFTFREFYGAVDQCSSVNAGGEGPRGSAR
ncbi:DUF3291 domain-containing protein [Microbispora amethystogenes]|uniref:DUF3291 domain-containing protein n=1 Tax=Microbispora amethystogenes TaxID=1427754 RepID=A0ABQ4FBY4_9ACTN|nr:DUF3291 domain-containing protein [Microbispora amethystogenes]GIH32335.1 hypothetical protein Mam01_24990 [Microbispora amethystogenes]